MPRYGHRFDTEEIAQWFEEFCSGYSYLQGHVVRIGKIVGVDDELGAKFDAEGGIRFVLMTNSFDAVVSMAMPSKLGNKPRAAVGA